MFRHDHVQFFIRQELAAVIIIIIAVVLGLYTCRLAPLQDCQLRSAPSPASVKHNGVEGREEGDGVMKRYLVKGERK